MKKIVLQIILSILCFSIKAQKVYNIRAEQRGKDVVVSYKLETNSPCEIFLLSSEDDGETWCAYTKKCSGDIGKGVSSGEKQIIWHVLEDVHELVGDKIRFKIIANNKNSLEPEMVFVEGGSFVMGSNSGWIDEKPEHKVTLSSFYISKFEVTRGLWVLLNGRVYDCDFSGINKPVEPVFWIDIQDFIKELNRQTGKNYRLPTEAEWEYAAKGGKYSKGYKYSGSNDISTVAWYRGNSDIKTHDVGTKLPNEIGVFDMSGNALEWCSDVYGSYAISSETNPTGPLPTGVPSGEDHVLRGGSTVDGASPYIARWFNNSNGSRNCYGFRLVLPIEDESKSEIQTETIKTDEEPLTYVEEDAQYPGGTSALFKFISENLVYPEDAVENGIEGKVIVKFVVDIDGVAKDFEIERTSSGGQSLERAAIDVCKRLGKFKPAMQNGKPIKSYYSQAIVFQLAD